MIESNSASSSANDVSIRHCTSGWRERISRHTSTPSPSGSRTSSTATSARADGRRDRASSAVPASPTTTISPPLSASMQLAHAAPDDLVVVEKENPDRHDTIIAQSAQFHPGPKSHRRAT